MQKKPSERPNTRQLQAPQGARPHPSLNDRWNDRDDMENDQLIKVHLELRDLEHFLILRELRDLELTDLFRG